MSCDLSLLNMPDIALREILKKLDFVSVQRLRRTCHGLRNFIDDTEIDSAMDNIFITLTPKLVQLHLHFEFGTYKNQYNIHENQSKLTSVKTDSSHDFEKKVTYLEKSDFPTIALKDLGSVLRNQKSVIEKVRLDFLTSEAYPGLSESFKQKLPVKNLHLAVCNPDQILQVLPFIDPEYVEYILLINTGVLPVNTLELENIVRLDQWKCCKNVQTDNFYIDAPVQNLLHLKNANVSYKTLTRKMILEFKKAFITSPHMEYFSIFFAPNNSYETLFIEMFGPQFEIEVFDELEKKWFFNIPDTRQVLTIVLHSDYINLNRIDRGDVPLRAFVNS